MRKSLLATRVENLSFPAPPILAEPEGVPSDTPIRLNLNESPFSPSPRAIAAMQSAIKSVNFYPDHGCTALVNALSEKIGIPTDQFSFGNGSGELLIAAGMLVTEEGDEAVFPAPTFPTCGKGVELSGGKIVSVPVTKDGICDVDTMLDAITERTRLFYLCTPNNPTGGILSQTDLDKAIIQVPGNCLLVIDEAYYEFAQYEGAPDVLKSLSNRQGPWIVTRTFSKAYALSGLRVGYAISSEKSINDGIWKLRANFNTNRIALAAATAALGDHEHLDSILRKTIAQREGLADATREMGCKIYPSSANFLTIAPPVAAKPIQDALAKVGFLVQALPWPDKNGTLRITIGDEKQMSAFINALSNILK